MTTIKLGSVVIIQDQYQTRTVFDDGTMVNASHVAQLGQAELAAELGYESAEAMNREHDIAHSLLAYALGRSYSQTLWHVAHGMVFKHWREEEAAVLAFQKYARKLNINLVALARDMNR